MKQKKKKKSIKKVFIFMSYSSVALLRETLEDERKEKLMYQS